MHRGDPVHAADGDIGTSDGIRLKIAKRGVQDLPPVDIDHPDLA